MILFVIGQRNSKGTSVSNSIAASDGDAGLTSRTWEVADGGLGEPTAQEDVQRSAEVFQAGGLRDN